MAPGGPQPFFCRFDPAVCRYSSLQIVSGTTKNRPASYANGRAGGGFVFWVAVRRYSGDKSFQELQKTDRHHTQTGVLVAVLFSWWLFADIPATNRFRNHEKPTGIVCKPACRWLFCFLGGCSPIFRREIVSGTTKNRPALYANRRAGGWYIFLVAVRRYIALKPLLQRQMIDRQPS